MFECKGNAGLLRRVIECIAELIIECRFDCSENGMVVQAMDSTHVCLAAINLLRDGFLHYDCSQPLVIDIPIDKFKKILACSGPDDTFTLRFNGGSVLLIMFETPTRDRITDFELNLLDIEQDAMSVPELEPHLHVQMNSIDLKRIVKDYQTFGDVITISGTKDGVTYSINGDFGKGNILIKPVDPETIPANDPLRNNKMDITEPVVQKFSLKYFSNFMKNTASDIVVLDLVNDMPMCLTYPLGVRGSVKFYLAPKIDDL